MNEENILTNRLFSINSYGDDFVTGVCADGQQVVMGLLCPNLVAYFFNPKGQLVRNELRIWNHPAPQMSSNGPYRLHDIKFQTALASQFREWQQSIGFTPQPIHIHAFFNPVHYVGVTLFPEHLKPPEEEWQELSEKEQQEIEQSRAKWLTTGQFIWWWAKDYWMASEGRVTST